MIAWQTSEPVWSCEDEAVIAWQTRGSVWSCEDERLWLPDRQVGLGGPVRTRGCHCLADECVCVVL